MSYDHKHNEANGEDNRDGTDHNRSWNYGVEGETDDPAIIALRTRQARNIAATLLLSTGTPMITMGDEMWRTQGGNNNAYCQDNEISWVNWDLGRPGDANMLAFFRRTLAIRSEAPGAAAGRVLRRPRARQRRRRHPGPGVVQPVGPADDRRRLVRRVPAHPDDVGRRPGRARAHHRR